jgi:hypothetical protein
VRPLPRCLVGFPRLDGWDTGHKSVKRRTDGYFPKHKFTHCAKIPGRKKIPGDSMRPSDTDRLLSVQANIICLLLFVVGVATIVEYPEWFR